MTGPMRNAAPAHGPYWNKKQLVLAAALLSIFVGVIAVVFTSGLMDVMAALVLGLREAGPVIFFLAMALLPAAGFPLLAFTLAAGPVFGPTLGPAWVAVWSIVAVVANLLLTYWLAHRALRPLLVRLLSFFGVPSPEIFRTGAWQITWIVRLTPGPPFWVQSYLLGLIRVPLMPYLAVSTMVMAGYIVALVYGGAALAEGNWRLAFVAGGLLVALIALMQLLRQRKTRRQLAGDKQIEPPLFPAIY
jgi:uncharacterized membrane protein YdjX (TVP38/TMEM64 family)